MRSKFKKTAAFVLAVIMTAGTLAPLPVMASWKKTENGWYYYRNDDDSSSMIVNDWVKSNDRWYYFGADGRMVTGWKEIKNVEYYFAEKDSDDGKVKLGQMMTDWQQIGDEWYYFDSEGHMVTGWRSINDKWYYFGSDGKMQTGFINVDGKDYYMMEDGSMYSGIWWQKIGDEWMYFDDETGEILASSKPEGTKVGIDVSVHQGDIDWKAVKEFGIDFAMIRLGYVGPELDDSYLDNIKGAIDASIDVGVYYYSRATTVETAIAEAQYVIDNLNGYKISYPVAIDVENAYATNWENMSMADITAIVKGFCNEISAAGYTPMVYSNLYWLISHLDASQLDGIEVWQARYYCEPSDKYAYDIWQGGSSTYIAGIDGSTVDIDFSYKDYSSIITPRTSALSTYAKTIGIWRADDTGWWYSYISGGYPSSQWMNLYGNWYYFNDGGYMLTGWQRINGDWYFFGDAYDGVMKTGWQKLGDKLYFFTDDGIMLTGWQELNGQWYYFGDDGAARTEWAQVNDTWYYFGDVDDGAMKEGWQEIGGRWYFFATGGNGAMLSGWEYINDKWYYLGAYWEGWMKEGWMYIDGCWYFLEENGGGAMVTGWREIGGKWYFFGDDGVMATSTWVWDYYVDEDGVWIE